MEVTILSNLGFAHTHLGETKRAIVFAKKSLEIARSIGDRRSEGRALSILSVNYAVLGQSERFVGLLDDAADILTEIESPLAKPMNVLRNASANPELRKEKI